MYALHNTFSTLNHYTVKSMTNGVWRYSIAGSCPIETMEIDCLLIMSDCIPVHEIVQQQQCW